MSQISQKAADMLEAWISKHGIDDKQALIDYAYSLTGRYGQAAGALACQMYEATAAAQGAVVQTAEMAELPERWEVAKAVQGTMKQSQAKIPDTAARLVKQVGADTTLKNARRDGAQFAWIPHGDTCAFCVTLASRGWQDISKNALRNGHAEHIHANCNCEYAVRFDGRSTVAGYDPEKYLEEYNAAGGDINTMRRARYAENKDKINEQKRAAYTEKRGAAVDGKSIQGNSTETKKRDRIKESQLFPKNPVTGNLYVQHEVTMGNAQFGIKVGKHARDYGLDPSDPVARDFMRKKISNIISNADERCYGEWRGQEYPVLFHIKDNDVVVESENGEFITILKGGVSNARVKNARKSQV